MRHTIVAPIRVNKILTDKQLLVPYEEEMISVFWDKIKSWDLLLVFRERTELDMESKVALLAIQGSRHRHEWTEKALSFSMSCKPLRRSPHRSQLWWWSLRLQTGSCWDVGRMPTNEKLRLLSFSSPSGWRPTHMQHASQLTIMSQLHIDFLIQTQPDQIQRLLDRRDNVVLESLRMKSIEILRSLKCTIMSTHLLLFCHLSLSN